MSRHRRPDDADEPVGGAREEVRWAPPYEVPRYEPPRSVRPPRPAYPPASPVPPADPPSPPPYPASTPVGYVPRRSTPPLPSAARARKPAKPAKPANPANPARAPRQATGARGRLRLRINPITCAGHGLCAELLPELLVRDEWGYPAPIVAEVPAELEVHAQRAAQQCPTLAILLERRRPRPDAG